MNVKYPNIKIKLTGEDGNVFFIMGKLSKALRKSNVPSDEINSIMAEITNSGSYTEALGIIMRTVETY